MKTTTRPDFYLVFQEIPLTLKTTSTRDRSSRSKQQFDSISEKKFADPFVKFTFLLTILDNCTSTKAFILSDFPHPFFGCLHFTVCHPVTPWNFSTGRVFWSLTVSFEDSGLLNFMMIHLALQLSVSGRTSPFTIRRVSCHKSILSWYYCPNYRDYHLESLIFLGETQTIHSLFYEARDTHSTEYNSP